MVFPLGVTLTEAGAHFAVWSRHAAQIIVCLFDGEIERRIPLLRKGDRHDAFVIGVKAGQHYGLRADGPWDERAGHRFDVSKLLIDPYATELTAHGQWREELAVRGVNAALFMPKCVVRPALPLAAPLIAKKPNFILEVPVKAFTMLHPDVPEHLRGTVAALAHPSIIAHFKSIGCDAIELMPIMAWSDERHLARAGLRNAWGYNPVSFFAPELDIAPGGLAEVCATVEVLHAHGIRVILDVVFNHTAESDFGGGTFSLRGLDQASYYRMHKGALVNDTGCGNTLALDREPGISLVLDSLRHWVNATGVDGFRYDLAPVMGRTATGFRSDAPLLVAIQSDPLLAPLIHIAEPWDVGPGGYQVGNFAADWHEWNDHFRDDVRRFWRGDAGVAGKFATRIAGSSDIFQKGEARPSRSINFVAAHDGFALADVVRFNDKHNHANGENNRDGNDGEVCWVDAAPSEKVKAMLASLFFARGTIMMTAGDEFGRTQRGNNNAYAQDNEVTWRDWTAVDQSLIAFVRTLAVFREAYRAYFADTFLEREDIVWFGADGQALGDGSWTKTDVVGMAIRAEGKAERLAVVFSRKLPASKMALPTAQDGMNWNAIELASAHCAVYIESR